MDTIFSKLSEKKIETNVFLNNYKKPYLQYQLCHKRQINYICYNLILVSLTKDRMIHAQKMTLTVMID